MDVFRHNGGPLMLPATAATGDCLIAFVYPAGLHRTETVLTVLLFPAAIVLTGFDTSY
jgi:hypothetical protein